MIELPPDNTYGATRQRRASVTYPELERVATTLLKSGLKPGIESIRQALGGGSPLTIQTFLNRYWRELGERIDGPAPALKRMPPDIADLADELWQRALTLAGEASTQDDNAAKERLEQRHRDHDVRSHALALRERELASLLESRERTVRELESHLRTTMSLLSRGQTTIRALEVRITAAEAQVEEYRQRLANTVGRAGAHSRALRSTKPRPASAATLLPDRKHHSLPALERQRIEELTNASKARRSPHRKPKARSARKENRPAPPSLRRPVRKTRKPK
jgi:uncharacterized membrane-anchored protein YhcB (DUF1043 family)